MRNKRVWPASRQSASIRMRAIAIVFGLWETCIKGNMADDRYVIGKSDVRVMLGSIIARRWRIGRIGINNESALDVD